MLARDWDFPICIDGMEGAGKSDLALKLAKRIDEAFRIDTRHIVYRGQMLEKRVYELPPRAAIIHDEFGVSALNRQAMTAPVIELVKALIVCRDQNKAIVVCVPSIWILDPYVRNHRIKYWLHIRHVEYMGIPVRGYIEVRKAIPNTWGDEPFWQYLGTIKVQKVDPIVYAAYKTLKATELRKIREAGQAGSMDSMAARNQSIVEAHERGMSFEKIGQYWDLTKQTVAQAYHSTVRQAQTDR